MLVKSFGAAVQGIDATIITVEVNVSSGIKFFLVGLPDNAIKESHERIMSAFGHKGYKFPRQQVIINMAPADIRSRFIIRLANCNGNFGCFRRTVREIT